jgi:hypothetical protein
MLLVFTPTTFIEINTYIHNPECGKGFRKMDSCNGSGNGLREIDSRR